MGDIINLNRYRKLRDQRKREQDAVSNRAKFGRTKTESRTETTTRDRNRRELDGKKIDEPA
ncbi:MAG: DUF4169 family protein [Rhodospirillaceae bacterium]